MAKATTNPIAGAIRPYVGPVGAAAGTGMIQGAQDGLCALATGANQQCIGVVAETDVIGSGQYGLVRSGETIALCGAAVAAGNYVKMDATSRFIPTTAAGDYIYGRAVSSTIAAGDEFVLEICPFIR